MLEYRLEVTETLRRSIGCVDMPKLFISGIVLVFLSLILANYHNYAMRSGLTTLAMTVEPDTEVPKPSEIADDMILNSNLGFMATGIGFLGLLLIGYGSRRNPTQHSPENSGD